MEGRPDIQGRARPSVSEVTAPDGKEANSYVTETRAGAQRDGRRPERPRLLGLRVRRRDTDTTGALPDVSVAGHLDALARKSGEPSVTTARAPIGDLPDAVRELC